MCIKQYMKAILYMNMPNVLDKKGAKGDMMIIFL